MIIDWLFPHCCRVFFSLSIACCCGAKYFVVETYLPVKSPLQRERRGRIKFCWTSFKGFSRKFINITIQGSKGKHVVECHLEASQLTTLDFILDMNWKQPHPVGGTIQESGIHVESSPNSPEDYQGLSWLDTVGCHDLTEDVAKTPVKNSSRSPNI